MPKPPASPLLTAALTWRKKNPPKRPLLPSGRYTPYLPLARQLRDQQQWHILDIARFLQETQPALKPIKLLTIHQALIRQLKR